MIGNVKDTLESMKLRLAHVGANVKDLVYFNIVLTSLLPNSPGKSKDQTIQERLQDLVDECLDQLRQDHVPIHLDPPNDTLMGDSASVMSLEGTGATGFDPSWAGFPEIDIFQPIDESAMRT